MEKLKEVYHKSGLYRKLVKRTSGTALYSIHVSKDGQACGYEVFIVKVLPRREAFGKIYGESEAFPSDSTFGRDAWSFLDLQRAEQKYNQLTEEESKRKEVLVCS